MKKSPEIGKCIINSVYGLKNEDKEGERERGGY